MHSRGTTSRVRIFHWSIFAAAHQKRGAAVARALPRLLEKHRSNIGCDDPPAGPIRHMLRHQHLTLIWLDRRQCRQQVTRKCISGDNHPSGNNGPAIRHDVVLVRVNRAQATNLGSRIKRNAIAQRSTELAADILERMIGSIPRDEAAEETGVYPKFFGDFAARPDRDTLSVLSGERDLVAEPLFLPLVGGDLQPTAR